MKPSPLDSEIGPSVLPSMANRNVPAGMILGGVGAGGSGAAGY